MIQATEAQLQRTIMDALELGGWLYSHHPDSRRSEGGGGLPDLVAVHPKSHAVIFIEVKTEAGRLRPKQEEWLHALERAQVITWVARPSNLDDLISLLINQPSGT